MKPTDLNWRDVLNDPAWDEIELRRLICICEEKIAQLWKAKHGK